MITSWHRSLQRIHKQKTTTPSLLKNTIISNYSKRVSGINVLTSQLSPRINIHILFIVLDTFLIVLIGRIFNILNFYILYCKFLSGKQGWCRGDSNPSPTNATRIRFPDLASYVGGVCCCSCFERFILPGSPDSPHLKNQLFSVPTRSGDYP